MSFTIKGTGSALPRLVVTNDDLSRIVDTSDEWITTRTGVKERRVLSEETLTDLALEAAEKAMADAGVKPEELDFILCATIRGDVISPSMGCLLQGRLGAHCPAMDVNAACSGFMYALDVAGAFFSSGRVKKMLVVAAEALSPVVDWTDRTTCVLFGDAAGAAVLEEGDDLLAIRLQTRGTPEPLRVTAFPARSPFMKNAPAAEDEAAKVHMNGQEVYKFAVGAMTDGLRGVIAAAGLKDEDVDWVLPHQANIRIIEAAKQRLNIAPERFLHNMERYGNTSAASIPVLLDECRRAGIFRPGDILAMSAFGAGLTSGACLIRWSI